MYSSDEEHKELSNEELIETIKSTDEKSSEYFKILKYTVPSHYDGVFD